MTDFFINHCSYKLSLVKNSFTLKPQFTEPSHKSTVTKMIVIFYLVPIRYYTLSFSQ